jgi:predicted MFS family arabinose efflux permease
MAQPLSPDIVRANTRYLYWEVFWMSISFAMEWYFMQVFAIRLGATPAHLGALTSVRALLLAVGSGFASRWQGRYDNLITAVRGPMLVYRAMLYIGIALSASLPTAKVDFLVVMVVLAALPTGISQGCFLSVLRRAVSERELATVVARRMVLLNGGVLVFVIGFGQFLEALPFPINYQLAFGIAFAASFVAWLNIVRVKVPDTPHVDPAQAAAPRINVWKHPEFARFMVSVVVICTGVFMAAPLVQLHLVRGLHASDAWISVFGLFEMGAGALFTLRLDRLIGRFGTGTLMIVTAFATIFQTLILSLTTTLPPFIVGQIAFGMGWFSLGVLMYNRLTEIAPPDDFPRYATVYQMLVNLSLFIGPLIGTFLIEYVMTVPAALLVVAAVRSGAAIWTLVANRRQAAVQAVEPAVKVI